MKYSRAMMRIVLALALAATLAGCDEKKDTAAANVAPVAMPAVAPSGAAVAPSDAAVAPSGAAVAPSGAAVAPSGAKRDIAKGDKTATKSGAAGRPLFPPGVMPHGNPEDGTLKYNPPPAPNPPAKKGATTP